MIVFRDHDFTKRSSSVLASEPMVHVFRSSFSFRGCTLLGNGSHIPPTGFARKIHRLKSAAFQKRICFLVPWRFKHFEHLEGVTKTTPPDSFHDLSCLSAEGLSLTATAVVRGPLDSGDLGDLGFGATATCWCFRNREKAVELGSLFWLFAGFYTCWVVVWDF